MSKRRVDPSASAVQDRLRGAHCELVSDPDPSERAYSHSALCQASLPYRVSDDVRVWNRVRGRLMLQIDGGYAPRQVKGEVEPVGLPYGPKARLVLIHIMTQAVITRDPMVHLEDSLAAFLQKVGIATNGRNMRVMREQVRRIATATFRLFFQEDRTVEVFHGPLTSYLKIFDHPGEPPQAWPSTMRLDDRFYENLLEHAVPLDPRALGALKHSSSAMDTYLWLSQRLCRVAEDRTELIPWSALHEQLGGSTKQVYAWKQDWLGTKAKRLGTLPQVLEIYPAAADALEATDRGLRIARAEPPIPRWDHDLPAPTETKPSPSPGWDDINRILEEDQAQYLEPLDYPIF